MEVAGYQMTFRGVEQIRGPNYIADQGTIEVTRDGDPVARPDAREAPGTRSPRCRRPRRRSTPPSSSDIYDRPGRAKGRRRVVGSAPITTRWSRGSGSAAVVMVIGGHGPAPERPLAPAQSGAPALGPQDASFAAASAAGGVEGQTMAGGANPLEAAATRWPARPGPGVPRTVTPGRWMHDRLPHTVRPAPMPPGPAPWTRADMRRLWFLVPLVLFLGSGPASSAGR